VRFRKGMAVEFLRKFRRQDNFRLDANREVIIDGKEFIIVGFDADDSYDNLTRLSVSFAPLSNYKRRNKNG
jgi:hypothetical protein